MSPSSSTDLSALLIVTVLVMPFPSQLLALTDDKSSNFFALSLQQQQQQQLISPSVRKVYHIFKAYIHCPVKSFHKFGSDSSIPAPIIYTKETLFRCAEHLYNFNIWYTDNICKISFTQKFPGIDKSYPI